MKTLITLILLAISTTVAAEPSPSLQKKLVKYCTAYSGFAGAVMKYRQVGSSRASLFEMAEGFESLVIEAYRVPRYTTERYIVDSVKEFEDTTFIDCIEKGGKVGD